nr:PREDICTED: uncharacterized protein LOC105663849 [Megachile rotundata]
MNSTITFGSVMVKCMIPLNFAYMVLDNDAKEKRHPGSAATTTILNGGSHQELTRGEASLLKCVWSRFSRTDTWWTVTGFGVGSARHGPDRIQPKVVLWAVGVDAEPRTRPWRSSCPYKSAPIIRSIGSELMGSLSASVKPERNASNSLYFGNSVVSPRFNSQALRVARSSFCAPRKTIMSPHESTGLPRFRSISTDMFILSRNARSSVGVSDETVGNENNTCRSASSRVFFLDSNPARRTKKTDIKACSSLLGVGDEQELINV